MEEVVEMAEHYQRDRRELVTTTWERVTCLRPKPTGLLSTEIAHPHLVYIPESREPCFISTTFQTLHPRMAHLSEELTASVDRIKVKTKFGSVTGARASTGAVVFLGAYSRYLTIIEKLRELQRYPLLYHPSDGKILNLCQRVFSTRTKSIYMNLSVSTSQSVHRISI